MNFVKICILFFIVACAYAKTMSIDEFNKKMVCEVNKIRKQYNLPFLAISEELTKAAQRHSNYQSKNNVMTHNESKDGYRSSMDRIKKAGFPDPNATAENVAYGYKSIAQVMKGWMNSSGHRANILNKKYTYFGAGKVGEYWTQDFAASRTTTPKNVKMCP